MGEDLRTHEFDATALRRFSLALLDDLEALETLLDDGRIESGVRRIGAEQEMFLVDRAWRPAPVNLALLEALDDPAFTTELGSFNIELNSDPLSYGGDCLSRLESDLLQRMDRARSVAAGMDVRVVLAGILPTLRKSDLALSNMTPRARYRALNDALTRMRGGSWRLFIRGIDEVATTHDSVMLESACTSFQVHLQVDPDEFAPFYNLSQVIAAPLLAAACNSPLLFGRRLWQETRIPVFQQSIDTRQAGDHLRQASPRVRFGEGWIDESILELFREDVVRFRALLGEANAEDPFEAMAAGRAPELRSLRLHNGTVYRWNRGCYGITDGKPHLRIEMRPLPAGPSIRDEVANAALAYGLTFALHAGLGDVRRHMDFDAARANFQAAAKHGLDARFTWLSGHQVAARELLLEELLPAARSGLVSSGVDPADAARYLDVVQGRVASGRTGSYWQLDSFDKLAGRAPRQRIMTALTAATADHQERNEPVHEWAPAPLPGGTRMDLARLRVEEIMTTDVYTVGPDEPVDLVGKVMEWKSVRHIPVEDADGDLVGLVSCFEVLAFLGARTDRKDAPAISALMDRDPLTVAPETSVSTCLQQLREAGSDCLLVARDGKLMGIATERDFVGLLGRVVGTVAGGSDSG